MFSVIKPHREWSDIGLRVLIGSIAAAVVLAVADGVMRGPVNTAILSSGSIGRAASFAMFSAWIVDLRYVAEQVIGAAAILFVGAKFFETRTIFSVGFDKVDTSKVAMKGPDDDNIVWIGYRYSNRLEAESVAAAFQDRLTQSSKS